MSKKATAEMIDVMRAYVKGEQIEVKPYHEKIWASVVVPSWNWELYEFRVKPKQREWWEIYPSPYHFSSEEAAKSWMARSCAPVGCKVIHVREVIE